MYARPEGLELEDWRVADIAPVDVESEDSESGYAVGLKTEYHRRGHVELHAAGSEDSESGNSTEKYPPREFQPEGVEADLPAMTATNFDLGCDMYHSPSSLSSPKALRSLEPLDYVVEIRVSVEIANPFVS